jgi:MIP family channel proteins
MNQKSLAAELIGTFALCFGGILSIHNSSGNLLIPAFAHGLILVVFISAFGAVSGGHFNPAVTAAMLVTKRMKPNEGIAYMIAQVVGGALGSVAVIACGLTKDIVASGTPTFASPIGILQANIVEAILTGFLIFAVLGTAVDKRAPKVGGLFIGLTVTFDILAGGPITGGAMNPARWLGPTLITMKDFGHAAVYLIGPFVGAILAALICDKVIAPDQAAE